MNRPLLALSLAWCGGEVVAQTSHVVGAGGFGTINAAVAAAVPGDVILVHPGVYQFTGQLTIGVTIRAITSGTVTISSAMNVSAPAPQAAHLVGLQVSGLYVSGTVSVDECTVLPTSSSAAMWATGANLTLQDCAIGAPGAPYLPFGFFAGLNASDSTVSAVDTSFRGYDYETTWGSSGHPGIYLVNSTLQGAGLSIEGGDGLAGPSNNPGVGVKAIGASTVWISDSTIAGGRAVNLAGSPHHACPVDATSGRLARCTLDPAASCPPQIPVIGPGFAARRTTPLTAGASFGLACQGEPNRLIAVWMSFGLGIAQFPQLEQPVQLNIAIGFPVAVLVADNLGQSSASWNLPPNTANLGLWVQAVEDGPLPLQVSPVVGGVIR